ncbi:MAG: hypothetical protein H6R04_1949 [Burkholderiaceae bacterium]|nr:hypothetical protein [Burkholderiaceae bacterium]
MGRTKIELELDHATVEALAELAARCNHCSVVGDGFASHGAAFSVATLLAMLADDAAKVVTEPESWQGANLRQVLASHGYLVNRFEQ